jgi:hypothetical protein
MKYALVFFLLLAGCTSRTEFGNCIGLMEPQKPGLEYKLSIINLVVAVALVETIIVPIVVAATEVSCPVGTK